MKETRRYDEQLQQDDARTPVVAPQRSDGRPAFSHSICTAHTAGEELWGAVEGERSKQR